MQLGFPGIPGILEPRNRHVESGAKIGQIGHLGWLARVDIRGDLVRPTLDSLALISPMVPCIRVWLAVPLAACCSPRGWSRDGAENSKKGKNWQCGTHCRLHKSS